MTPTTAALEAAAQSAINAAAQTGTRGATSKRPRWRARALFGRALTPAPRTPNRDFAWVPVYIFGSVYYTISLFIERMGALNWVLHAALAVICVRLAGVTLANGIRTLLDELYDDLTEGDEEIFVIMSSVPSPDEQVASPNQGQR